MTARAAALLLLASTSLAGAADPVDCKVQATAPEMTFLCWYGVQYGYFTKASAPDDCRAFWTNGELPEGGGCQKSQPPSPVRSAGSLLGVYRGAAPSGPQAIDQFSAWLGRKVDIASDFEAMNSWSDIAGADWQLGAWQSWVGGTGRLALAVPMLPRSGGSLAQCSAGSYNDTWATLAKNLSKHGLSKTILRPGWELNGNWYPWSAIGKTSEYAGCFRQIVTSMRAVSASFEFDWNQAAGELLMDAYPGDAYVDYVGVDAYSQRYGSVGTWAYVSSPMQSLAAFAKAHGKQLSIPEWGIGTANGSHGGGDDAEFVQRMHDFIDANDVAYQSYFDFDASDGNHRISPSTPFSRSSALYRSLFSETGS